jgi:hypothetical protein
LGAPSSAASVSRRCARNAASGGAAGTGAGRRGAGGTHARSGRARRDRTGDRRKMGVARHHDSGSFGPCAREETVVYRAPWHGRNNWLRPSHTYITCRKGTPVARPVRKADGSRGTLPSAPRRPGYRRGRRRHARRQPSGEESQ